MKEVGVLLHNVRSAHNVGSIFRTADAAGVRHIYLTGYTPRPVDRFGQIQKEIAKTALGAEKYLPWTYEKTPGACIAALKKQGWKIVGVEQDTRSIDYRKFQSKTKTVFLLGNEVLGISKSLRETCDAIIEIPMQGKKESLNVSVAAGIILFNT